MIRLHFDLAPAFRPRLMLASGAVGKHRPPARFATAPRGDSWAAMMRNPEWSESLRLKIGQRWSWVTHQTIDLVDASARDVLQTR
jgi:hypothetical protein